jgi:peroxiredoxin
MTRRLFTFFLLFSLSGVASSAALDRLIPGPAALGDFTGKGKWLVVMLWASDCIACNREARQYVDFHEFHEDSDATILGISLDGSDQAAAQGFIDKHDVSFPNLIVDFEGGARWFESLTGQRFLGTPGFLIIDPQGSLRAQQIGAVPVNLIEQFIEANTIVGQAATN